MMRDSKEELGIHGCYGYYKVLAMSVEEYI